MSIFRMCCRLSVHLYLNTHIRYTLTMKATSVIHLFKCLPKFKSQVANNSQVFGYFNSQKQFCS